MDIDKKSKSELWDYYQDLVKAHGFNGITDLLTSNARLQSVIDAQQSPAVAVPDDEFNHDTDNHHSAMAIDEEQAFKDEIEWRESDEYKEMEAKLSSPSPRITEQDAREIILSYLNFNVDREYSDTGLESWCSIKSRALLAKLNDKPESVGG